MHLLPVTIRHRVAERDESPSIWPAPRPIEKTRYEPSSPELDDLPRFHGANGDTVDRTTYRRLPIFSGILIPFSIMLSIPSLTGHWYVRTGDDHILLESRPNPPLLDIGMAFSMACGVLANICLVIRFSERRIQLMTVLCIMFLSLHDIINIPAVTIFGVIHRFDDGFTYGQPFWLTVCSTILSTATNITLIYDYSLTEDFKHSGSGLTHKQRALVIILIILLCYVSLGSALLAVTLNISFLDGLYLSVVSIETIGFGDLHPTSTGTRILACFFISGGILNLALLVALSREALLEAAAEGVQARMRAARAHARERNIRSRWRAAVHWRLKAQGLPTWIDDRDDERHGRIGRGRSRHWYSWPRRVWRRLKGEAWREWEDPAWKYVYGPGHKRLNLEALPDTQLETAALEAGLPLSELIPKDLRLQCEDAYQNGGDPLSMSWRYPFLGSAAAEPGRHPPSLTHVRMGGMISLLANFALAVTHGTGSDGSESPGLSEDSPESSGIEENVRPRGVPFTRTLTSMTMGTLADDDEAIYIPESLETIEKNAFYARLSLALMLFFIFWMAGSAIFMKTEGWTFGSAMYFCFISFTTVGYGDLAPKTPAGRSIFIVWAMLGVGTMTILISILGEAYFNSYKSVIKSEATPAVTDMSSDNLSNRHMANRHISLLGARTVSVTSSRDQGPLPSSSSTVVGDRLTPFYSSILTNPISAHATKPRRATLMVTVPEIPHPGADKDDVKIPANLAALPMDVLRRVDHMMSIIATRSSPRTESNAIIKSDRGGRINCEDRVVDDRSKEEALLREIEENLAQIAKASKAALKEDKAFETFHA